MKTKKLIKRKSIELFNANGVRNITLRDVAKALDKSYGNITYHYATKEQLLLEIFFDLNKEINKNQAINFYEQDSFEKYIKISERNYSFLKKYYFVLVDKRDIHIIYPKVYQLLDTDKLILNSSRKSILLELQKQGLIKKNLTNNVFDFIMELTFGLTSLFFNDFQLQLNHQKEYVAKMKKLLFPYLTDKGKLLYIKH